MEQNTNIKTVKTNNKDGTTAIRFDKNFLKKVTKIVDKANRKQLGRKVKIKNILADLLEFADANLIEKVIKKSQQDSYSQKDKKEILFKNNMTKFSGSKEKFEEKMMELMDGYLLESPA